MGTFADLRWVDGDWVTPDSPGAPALWISIHDSDIATVGFAGAGDKVGLFYLGFEPATYFEDPAASQPVDHKAQARAFGDWAREAMGTDIAVPEVEALMAKPDGPDPEEAFVEVTVGRLLGLIGLEMPEIP